MLIGIARTSTLEQRTGLEAQLRELEAYGCEKIYQEQVSSVAEREQLNAALSSLRSGDKLVVTKLDRLARSVKHLGEIVETINKLMLLLSYWIWVEQRLIQATLQESLS